MVKVKVMAVSVMAMATRVMSYHNISDKRENMESVLRLRQDPLIEINSRFCENE